MPLTDMQINLLRHLKESRMTDAADLPESMVPKVVELIQMDPPMAYVIAGAIFVTTHGFNYLNDLDTQCGRPAAT